MQAKEQYAENCIKRDYNLSLREKSRLSQEGHGAYRNSVAVLIPGVKFIRLVILQKGEKLETKNIWRFVESASALTTFEKK